MGYSVERFFDPPPSEVFENFKCVFCRDILENAKVLSCYDFSCLSCLDKQDDLAFNCPKCKDFVLKSTITDPPRLFFNIYDTLEIFCSFDSCKNVFNITEIGSHELQCSNNPSNFVICKKVCGIRIEKSQAERHHCGDFFFGEIKRLVTRLEQLETEIKAYKENLKNKPIAVNKFNSSSSSSVSSFATKKASSDLSSLKLGPLGAILVKMIKKFNDFSFSRKPDRHSPWPKNSLFRMLHHLSSNVELKETYRYFNIGPFINNSEYDSIFALPLKDRGVWFLLNLMILEYLLNSGEIYDKRILLIGLTEYSLIPFYTSFSSKIVVPSNQEKCDRFTSAIKNHMPSSSIKIRFPKYSKSYDEYFKNNPEQIDIIIAFTKLTPNQSQRFLEVCCENGYLLSINKICFEKRSLNKQTNGFIQQEFEILENEQNIGKILHGTF